VAESHAGGGSPRIQLAQRRKDTHFTSKRQSEHTPPAHCHRP
jgi:hypothetical protein